MSRNYKRSKDQKNAKGNKTKDYRPKRSNASNDKQVDYEQKTNNPSWYMTNDSIVQGVAQLPLNLPTGEMFNTINPGVIDSYEFAANYGPKVATPGVAVFNVVPSFGDQRDPASSLNIASQAIYTWVRYYNSGARNYSPSDLMLYLVANAQIYSMINWAMRIYGTISQYDYRNKYLGKVLVNAMGINYTDFIGRMAEFRGRLNLLINKAASFVVPNTMTYFLRTASMYTDIYTDGDTIKDQLYMYNPVGFYRYTFDESEDPAHDAAYLKFHTLTADDHQMTVDDVIQYLDDSISALINAHDQAIISGDLYKAYQGNTLLLKEMAEDYRTNIVHDDWVLNQIKNATITTLWSYPDLYQDPAKGTILFDPKVEYTTSAGSAQNLTDKAFQVEGMHGDRVLTVPTANVGTDQVMEYTRLMTTLTEVATSRDDASNTFTLSGRFVSGSEIILRANFYSFSSTDAYSVPRLSIYRVWDYCRSYTSTVVDVSSMIYTDTIRKCFKYFPATLKYSVYQNKVQILGLDFDIDNYTLIDENELRHLHEVALMNMFATDAVAKLK